jgi:hypothetical protein
MCGSKQKWPILFQKWNNGGRMQDLNDFAWFVQVVVPDISLFASDTDTQEKAMKQITGVYTAPAQHWVGARARCRLL